MSFEPEKPGDFADDNIVLGESKLGTSSGVIARRKERLRIESAEDFRVLIRAANARCQILLFHGIGDDHKMGGGPGRKPFSGAEHTIGKRSLEPAKRGTMNGMDDDGHRGLSGGKAAKETGFAAVSVDNVRAVGAKG